MIGDEDKKKHEDKKIAHELGKVIEGAGKALKHYFEGIVQVHNRYSGMSVVFLHVIDKEMVSELGKIIQVTGKALKHF